jgi:hypothetical protein
MSVTVLILEEMGDMAAAKQAGKAVFSIESMCPCSIGLISGTVSMFPCF